MRLNDPALLCSDGYVGGVWRPSARRFAVTDPATGVVLARVADLTPKDMNDAIAAAKAAAPAWAGRTARERGQVLRRLHDLIVENADDLAMILTCEMGKPLPEARGEILYGAAYLDWFAEEARRLYGETIPGHLPDRRLIVLRQPVGVVGAITPWNFPNAMLARKLAPALAAGCTMVARPSELTPLSALALAALAHRAGVPAGVLNVLPSAEPAAIGQAMCAHPDLAKISFTGSTRVGALLMQQCAPGIKKLSLELGGNAPFIVFDDADLDKAVEGAIAAKFRNAGQTCVCANRFYVQAGIHDAFAARLAAAMAALRVGPGTEPGVAIGPLISAAARDKVRRHVADALDKVARLVLGGGDDLPGTYHAPTLLTGVTAAMAVTREETFGPLAAITRFETEAEVLGLANDTPFGLAGYFFSQDISRIWRVAEALETGMVGINTGLISTEVAPFGGIKQSGMGREGSRHGIEDYVNLKYLCMAI
jgi:succinate-semialdehyde dehydrogenase/glutarate-semialdehyde dehydrogenase